MNINFFSFRIIDERKLCPSELLLRRSQAVIQNVAELLLFFNRKGVDCQNVMLAVGSDHRPLNEALDFLDLSFLLAIQDAIDRRKALAFNQVVVEF